MSIALHQLWENNMWFALARLVIAWLLVMAAGNAEEMASLPLKRIVAYTAGVAFCEHAGEVTDNAQVSLTFPVESIDDVLKSLVVLDQDGGQASVVSYGNREPVARALRNLRIDLTENPSLGGLLRQLRGQSIEVTLHDSRKGQIVGVEARSQLLDGRPQQVDYLLLRTESGLQSIPLAEIRTLRLLEESLDADFQAALDLLASDTGNTQRKVTLQLRGTGKRRIRVGYIREFPVWKTTYRLVLEEEGSALLQGWAIVENTTLDDWHDVNLALVSGQPISFRMELYEPLYVQRPLVVPEAFEGLEPRLYELGEWQRGGGGRPSGGYFGGGGGAFGGSGGAAGFGGNVDGDRPGEREESVRDRLSLDLLQSQVDMVSTAELGELFRYQIDVPVSLRREQSAMVPIVGERIDAERVWIYNEQVHAKHPLCGVRLKNNGERDWSEGPLTVFDAGEYAGDARVGYVAPGGQRLVSYAMALDCEVEPQPEIEQVIVTAAKIEGGRLSVTSRRERTCPYVCRNASSEARSLIIERAIDSAWELDPTTTVAETTQSDHRFVLEVPASGTATLDVRESRTDTLSYTYAEIRAEELSSMIKTQQVEANAREAIEHFLAQREKWSDLQARRAKVQASLQIIADEQGRIRQNMANLDRSSALYEQYQQMLSKQEGRIEQLRLEQENLAAAIRQILPVNPDPFSDEE